jgi:DNA invertase Pin-like site-specific DNA recombinase
MAATRRNGTISSQSEPDEKAKKPEAHIGVSYARFSSPKQSEGDSEGRQERVYFDFCKRHSLTPATETFIDRGRSGYHDAHRKKGRFGELIAAANDNRFQPGTIIVVEAWDRLGRLRPDRQTALVAELLRTGVSIGICRLDDIFTEEDFGTHKWTTLAVFIQLAYQESKQKSERVGESWKKRRELARANRRPITSRGPAWLEWVNVGWRVIPERAAAIRRIFELSAADHGHTLIVKKLIEENVKPFGEVVINKGRTRSQFSGTWSKPYIALLLRDRRVLGEFQPLKDDKPDGLPIANYFPQIITEDQFLLARAGHGERCNKDSLGRMNPSHKHSKYVNVFKSMLKHARDKEGFLLHNKGTGDKPDLILINAKGNGGRSKSYTINYHPFEEHILRLMEEVDPREILPRQKEEPNKADVLKAKLANIREDLTSVSEDLKAGYSKTLGNRVRELETEEQRIETDLQKELQRTVKPIGKAWRDLPSLIDTIRNAEDPDEARLRLRPVLRRIIEEAWMLIVPRGSFRLVVVQFYFTGGKRRDFLIINQAAGCGRKGGWWSRSFSATTVPDDIDLRKPADVALIEQTLLDLDLSEIQTERARKAELKRKAKAANCA